MNLAAPERAKRLKAVRERLQAGGELHEERAHGLRGALTWMRSLARTSTTRYPARMGESARQLEPHVDDHLTTLEPPLTDDERRVLLESLADANVPESFRESVRRDIASL